MRRRIRIPRRGRIRAASIVLAVLAFLLAVRQITARRDAVLREIQFCAQELIGDDPRFTLREAWVMCAEEDHE